MVRINGENLDIDGMSIEDYLVSAGYDIGKVAVECNGQIVTKSDYRSVFLKDGDKIEVVSFVGGG